MGQPEIDPEGLVERRGVFVEVGAEDRADTVSLTDLKRVLIAAACHHDPVIKMGQICRHDMIKEISIIEADRHGFEAAHSTILQERPGCPSPCSSDMGRGTRSARASIRLKLSTSLISLFLGCHNGKRLRKERRFFSAILSFTAQPIVPGHGFLSRLHRRRHRIAAGRPSYRSSPPLSFTGSMPRTISGQSRSRRGQPEQRFDLL